MKCCRSEHLVHFKEAINEGHGVEHNHNNILDEPLIQNKIQIERSVPKNEQDHCPENNIGND